MLITSADSRIRVVDGFELVHKFKGFRNTNSQISACLSSNGRYVISASEDSHVYFWRNDDNSAQGRSKAVVSVTIDDEFVVHDIKVIEGEKGLFIAMPSRKASDGEYRDIAHPINSATREQIQTIILDKYQEVMAEEAENEVLMEAAE